MCTYIYLCRDSAAPGSNTIQSQAKRLFMDMAKNENDTPEHELTISCVWRIFVFVHMMP